MSSRPSESIQRCCVVPRRDVRQVDPPDGNVMSIVGDLDVEIIAVAAPDLSTEGTTVATMVATAGTTDATNAATTVATGVATDEKRQRRE